MSLRSWSTSPFDALGFRFQLRCGDRNLAAHVDELFSGFADSKPARHQYQLSAIEHPTGRVGYELSLDGDRLFEAEVPQRLVGSLVRDINRRAVEGAREFVLHASGVEHRGSGVVFPAPMESGKTTLAAGLVLEGLAYLTDEAIAIEPATHVVKPYPKPLSIDRGSWSLFPDLRSLADPNGDETEQWQVAPQCVGRIGRACPISVIAFVQYTPWGETELVSITRPEALIELTKNTFRFDARPRATLDLLTEVVRAADCYRFTIADQQEAVELVFNLLGVTTTAQETR